MLALKLRDCVILSVGSQVTENKCDNVIQLHPKVYLGCLACPPLFDALKQNLPPLRAGFTPTSVGQAAVMVKNIINNYVKNFPTTGTDDEFLVVGTLEVEKEFKIYKISKEKGHMWRHGVVEVVEPLGIGGICSPWVLEEHFKKNPFKPDMTEEEGVDYVFEGVKVCSIRVMATRGDIQLVVITFEGKIKNFKWRQINPTGYTDAYHLVAYSYDFSLS